MLLKGLNHVAVITNDATRLNDFYQEVFEAEILRDGSEFPDGRAPASPSSRSATGPSSTSSRSRGTPRPTARRRCSAAAGSITWRCRRRRCRTSRTIRERLMARGAADDFVTDFGPMLSLFFRDPDGLECEVCVENPDAVPGDSTRRGPGRRVTPDRRGRAGGQHRGHQAAEGTLLPHHGHQGLGRHAPGVHRRRGDGHDGFGRRRGHRCGRFRGVPASKRWPPPSPCTTATRPRSPDISDNGNRHLGATR